MLAPILWLGILGLGLAMGLAMLARAHPFFELFVHFAAQYLLAGILLALLALALRRYGAFALALGLGLGNLATLRPYVLAEPPPIVATGPVLRLVTANLNHMHADAIALQAFLENTDADLVVLTELAGQQEPAFAAMRERFPERLFTPGARHRPFALLVLARRKLQGGTLHYPRGVDFPVIEFRYCLDEANRDCLRVIALHAPRPGEEFGDLRDEMIGFAAERARAAGLAGEQVAVVGDLNTTAWGPGFDLLADLGLRDAGLGQGWQPTWPVSLGLAGIPIDHVAVSPKIGVERYRRLDPMGSDHRPLAVDLRLPGRP